ncbi:MAG: type II toxin-antitoxin system prevent-host-death family antitoxin [Terriglobales bacterium]|jgi:prevent-host-death family protein
MTYTIHQAKTQLSKLIQEACDGKEVVIARGDTPVVKLVSLRSSPERRIPGLLEGQGWTAPDSFDPLSDEEAKEWGIE